MNIGAPAAAPIVISPVLQHYAWGKVGTHSFISRVLNLPATERPLAEAWFGAHASAPSPVISSGVGNTLADIIKADPNGILGSRVAKRFTGELPFLFKILSIGAPLSIQAHPTEALAQELHKRDAKHYPDPHHKPEMSVALSPVNLLYGFKGAEPFLSTLKRYPELARISKEAATPKEFHNQIVNAKAHDYVEQVDALQRSLSAQSDCDEVEQLFLRLCDTYHLSDRGLLLLWAMNYVTLNPGDAIFIGPGVPHAYVSGDLLECMANSDNVVRGGLTPKYQDTKTLISMLDYSAALPQILEPVIKTDGERISTYEIAAKEFIVDRIEIAQSGEFKHNTEQSIELLFVLNGAVKIDSSLQLSAGSCVVIPAALAQYTLSSGSCTVYRVRVPK